jgi:hypothetical protein
MTTAISDLAPFDDTMTDAVGYNPATLTHSIYSENFSLLGIQPYTVTATLAEYSSVSTTANAEIEFLDPCPDPESVNSVPQTNPVEYYYSA